MKVVKYIICFLNLNYLNLNLVSKFENIFLIFLALIEYNVTLRSHSLLTLKLLSNTKARYKCIAHLHVHL